MDRYEKAHEFRQNWWALLSMGFGTNIAANYGWSYKTVIASVPVLISCSFFDFGIGARLLNAYVNLMYDQPRRFKAIMWSLFFISPFTLGRTYLHSHSDEAEQL